MRTSNKVSLPILTNSAEKAWRDCARKYQLAYLDLVRPINDGEALLLGTLAHKGLEAWWKAAQAEPVCSRCEGSLEVDEATGLGDRASREASTRLSKCPNCNGIDTRDRWLQAAIQAIADHPDEWRRATVEALLVGYHHRWMSMRWEGGQYDGQPIEVVGVEVEFNGPLVNPATDSPSKSMQRGGKIDVLVRVAGDVWVIEHKTTAEDFSAGSPYRARLRMDTQVSGYHVGARLLGHEDVKGVLYDVIGKPGLRPLKATPPEKRQYTKPTKNDPVPRLYKNQRENDETVTDYQNRVLESIAGNSDDYFARFEVVRLAHEEEAAARDTWQRMQEIRDAKRLGRFPRNPSACGLYNRPCPYLPICLGEATANDGTRYRKAENAHEELGGETQVAA